MTGLSTLLARVEAGSGADRELDAEIWSALTGHACHQGPDETWLAPWGGSGLLHAEVAHLTTDLNAVIGLVEARLPGWSWLVRTAEAKGAYAHVTSPEWTATWVVAAGADEVWQENGAHGEAYAPTPARALLAALLRAEMEKMG